MVTELTTPDNTFSENIFLESLRSTFSSHWRIPCHRNKTISLGDCAANTNLHGAIPHDLKKTYHSFQCLRNAELSQESQSRKTRLAKLDQVGGRGVSVRRFPKKPIAKADISSTFQPGIMIIRP